jgi:hypothetical protein
MIKNKDLLVVYGLGACSVIIPIGIYMVFTTILYGLGMMSVSIAGYTIMNKFGIVTKIYEKFEDKEVLPRYENIKLSNNNSTYILNTQSYTIDSQLFNKEDLNLKKEHLNLQKEHLNLREKAIVEI